jgi:hypothetical protein
MSKTFRAWKIDEPLFLRPMVGDFVAKDHLARFVLSLVRDDLGLGEITGTHGSERGQPPFDPTMMDGELAGLEIISAASAVHRPGLVVLDVSIPRRVTEQPHLGRSHRRRKLMC